MDRDECCSYCDGKIGPGRYIKALGRSFHAACFVCGGCGQVIHQSSFVEHAGRPYHEHCYAEQQAPRCAACGQPILGTVTGEENNVGALEGQTPAGPMTYARLSADDELDTFGTRVAVGGAIYRGYCSLSAETDSNTALS